MLQIALAPAPVAQDVIYQGGWCLLKRSPQTRQKPHPPPGTAQQAGLDKIMAHDHLVTAPKARAQRRQPGAGGKGLDPHNGIVAPVVALKPGPAGQTFGQSQAVYAIGKLLHATKNGLRPDELRKALDQTGAGIARQRIRQTGNSPPGHQTVGIQHQHGLVARAPAAQPIADIAHLAAGVQSAAAIIERHASRQGGAQGLDA